MHSRSPQKVLPRAELAEIPNKRNIFRRKKILDSDDLLIKVYNAESEDEDHNTTKICDEKTTTSWRCELSSPRCERYLLFFLLFSRPTLKIDQKIRDISTKQIQVVVQPKYWLLYQKRIGKPPIPSK